MISFKISLEKAEYLIEAYRKEFLDIPSPKVPDVIGGTIDKASIKDLESLRIETRKVKSKFFEIDTYDVYKGLAFWHCWKSGDTLEDSEHFLAFEVNDNLILDPNYPQQYPDADILARPFEIIKKPSVSINELLKASSDKFDPTSGEKIIKKGFSYGEEGTVHRMSSDFITDGPRRIFTPYNQKPFGLFENRIYSREVEEFIDQEGLEYVRYFFGFNRETEINTIRVILIGVDKNGKNMLPSVKDKVEGGDIIMLQNSWPPKTTP